MSILEEFKKELAEGKIKERHTSMCQGYVSRKADAPRAIARYSGKFGSGYVEYSPSLKSTRYCYITYYIEENN